MSDRFRVDNNQKWYPNQMAINIREKNIDDSQGIINKSLINHKSINQYTQYHELSYRKYIYF